MNAATQDPATRRAGAADLMDVVHMLPDVLFRCRKGRDGKIYWNLNEGGLADEFHLTTEEIRGKSLEELFPGGASEAVRSHFEAAFEGSTEPFTNEMGGRHFRHFPQPIYDDGNVVEVVGFITEVTELVQAQEALVAANRDLEAFVVSVSHDLRSPLSVIANLAGLLERRHGDALGTEGTAFVDRIQQTTRQMATTIDDMLALAHAASTALDPTDVDLSRVAEDAIQVLVLKEPGHHVDWQIEPHLAANMDPRHARLLMQNLLGNAAKYTRGCDRPTVRFRREPATDGDWFVVEDNGVGFVAAEAGRIFEPFERLHGGEFEGSGVGLATAERIVARHGGRIEAHSDGPGKGARFRFTLPAVGPR